MVTFADFFVFCKSFNNYKTDQKRFNEWQYNGRHSNSININYT